MVQQLLSAKDLKAQTDGMMSTVNWPQKWVISSSWLKPNPWLQTKMPSATTAPVNNINAIPWVNAPSPMQNVAAQVKQNPSLQPAADKAFEPKPTTPWKMDNIPVIQNKPTIDTSVYNDLIASISAHPEATVQDIQTHFPELKWNESTIPDLLASIKAHPDATPEQIQQYFPELSAEQAKAFADMNTYEKITYIPKNEEDKKNLPIRKRVLSVWTPTQETATAMWAAKNDLTSLEENIKGTLQSLWWVGKWWVALLDKLLWTDWMQVLNEYSMQTRWVPIGTLMEEDANDYKALLSEVEEWRADALKTTASQDVLNIAEWWLAAAQLAAAPMLFWGITVAASTDVWSKAMQAVNDTFGAIGWVVNMIPWLSDYRDSLPEYDQQRFDVFVGNVIWSLLLGTRGKKNIIKDPKTFIADNVGSKQVIENFKQNVIGIKDAVVEPIKKAWEVVADKLNPAINLDDAALAIAKENPYVAQLLNDIHDISDGDMSNTQILKDFKDQAIKDVWDQYVKPAIDAIIKQYSEWGKLYQDIRKSKQPIDVSTLEYDAKAIADKYDPSTLTPWDERLIASWLKQIDKIVESSKNGNFNADVALDARRALSDLTQYDEAGQRRSASNTKWDKFIKEVRRELDNRMKDQVKWLKEIDQLASKKIKQIKEVKKQIIKEDWSVNYNNLKLSNNLAKTDLAARLDEFAPWVTDMIKAIDLAIAMAKKTKGTGLLGKLATKSWMRMAWAILWSFLPWAWLIWEMFWYILGESLAPLMDKMINWKLSEANQAKILKYFNEMSPEAIARLKEIGKKIENNEKLSAADQKLIDTAKAKFNATIKALPAPKTEPIKSWPKWLKPK